MVLFFFFFVVKVLTHLQRGAVKLTVLCVTYPFPCGALWGKEKREMERGVRNVERIEGILTKWSTQTYHCITTLIWPKMKGLSHTSPCQSSALWCYITGALSLWMWCSRKVPTESTYYGHRFAVHANLCLYDDIEHFRANPGLTQPHVFFLF